MRASFFTLSLKSLPSVAFMLVNSSSKFTAPIIIVGMMTILDDSTSDCENTTLFGDDAEEIIVEVIFYFKNWRLMLHLQFWSEFSLEAVN